MNATPEQIAEYERIALERGGTVRRPVSFPVERLPSGDLPPMTEAQFILEVICLAKLHGWKVAHFRPAKTSKGWRTAVQGDGKGFPDLILVRERVIVMELKVGNNRLSPEQKAWLTKFTEAGIKAYCFWPRDFPEIERILA